MNEIIFTLLLVTVTTSCRMKYNHSNHYLLDMYILLEPKSRSFTVNVIIRVVFLNIRVEVYKVIERYTAL